LSKILIISPSGNFYGSEQVLFDYLSSTPTRVEVMVPKDSVFEKKLKTLLPQKQIGTFKTSGLLKLYTKLFFSLSSGKYNSIYLNEAGHIKYILLLSRIFRRKNFVVHVRISEDTEKNRWLMEPGENVLVLSISENIQQQLPYSSRLIYDPFIFSASSAVEAVYVSKSIFKIAIIGRITHTKGIKRLVGILDRLQQMGLSGQYHFFLFGDVSEDAAKEDWFASLQRHKEVTLAGFRDKKEIYEMSDAVMHLSTQEPLGRIFLETINDELPFIGINAAGIGEIGKLTGLEELLADPQSSDLTGELVTRMENVKNNYTHYCQQVKEQKAIAKNVFDIRKYCDAIDLLLT
jgi:glycosyltransferase involved in cell wall biosynthesis